MKEITRHHTLYTKSTCNSWEQASRVQRLGIMTPVGCFLCRVVVLKPLNSRNPYASGTTHCHTRTQGKKKKSLVWLITSSFFCFAASIVASTNWKSKAMPSSLKSHRGYLTAHLLQGLHNPSFQFLFSRRTVFLKTWHWAKEMSGYPWSAEQCFVKPLGSTAPGPSTTDVEITRDIRTMIASMLTCTVEPDPYIWAHKMNGM